MPEPSLEARFARACLLSQWDPSGLETAARLAAEPGFDPARLAPLADSEGVAPLLYLLLRDSSLLPAVTIEELARCFYQNQARNALLTRELEAFLNELSTLGVAVVLLKGAALDASIYPQPGLRPMGDLDVLVHPQDLDNAMIAAQKAGFQRHEIAWRPGWNARLMHHQSFSKAAPYPVELEIHWRLSALVYDHTQAQLPWFWQNLEAMTVGSAPAMRFAPLAQVLHLMSHIFVHESLNLSRLHDLARVILSAPTFDWDALLEQASLAGMVLPLQLLTPILQRDWLVPVPAQFSAALARRQPGRHELRVFRPIETWLNNPGMRSNWIMLKKMRSRERVYFILASIFPSPEYIRWKYKLRSAWQVPVYYVYRWLESAWRVIVALFNVNSG